MLQVKTALQEYLENQTYIGSRNKDETDLMEGQGEAAQNKKEEDQSKNEVDRSKNEVDRSKNDLDQSKKGKAEVDQSKKDSQSNKDERFAPTQGDDVDTKTALDARKEENFMKKLSLLNAQLATIEREGSAKSAKNSSKEL
ncbi:hypothetical protein Y032_0305g1946 [Ancylostoma ceylanicum]|uniref:Uncharacterized protein n=1 Tax=Ancylostoma ceylanicum TaxID=53326 RepID=A0A016S4C5_9BILA|nr:hypothetical protein Y032_0305g1946 [Ancylostoma ceylanicum]